MIIQYPERTEVDARGRNGTFQQHGLSVAAFYSPNKQEIWLRAITSRKDISQSARLVVPRSQIPALIEALERLK